MCHDYDKPCLPTHLMNTVVLINAAIPTNTAVLDELPLNTQFIIADSLTEPSQLLSAFLLFHPPKLPFTPNNGLCYNLLLCLLACFLISRALPCDVILAQRNV